MRTPGTSRALCLVALVSGLGLLTPDEKLAQSTGHVNFVLGQKSLDPDDWEPAEKQNELAVDASWGDEAWPIHIATDFSYSLDQVDVFDPSVGFPVKFTASTWELSVGYRKIWETRNIRIGIDARYSDAKVKISDVHVEAGGFHGGLILGWGWPASK